MTFKHVKFEDSPTMRALEKVAREKGLVKPEPLTKKASLVKKADLTPTDNLMQNVFKLCAGLREQGMVKDASDLETKYLQYKQSQTLYETSKETGEDVLEQAHPEGSHKLENVDSIEAVVEDLLDKHDLIEEVAEKDSKGDLKDTASAITAVKKVLGQYVGTGPGGGSGGTSSDTEKSPRLKYEAVVNSIIALCQSVLNSGADLSEMATPPRGFFGHSYTGSPLTHWTIKGHLEGMIDELRTELTQPSDADQINSLYKYLSTFQYLITTAKAISPADKTKYLGEVSKIQAEVAKAMNVASGKTAMSLRVKQLIALGQVDPEATKKGKEAMVQALQLIDRGMSSFLNAYFGPALEQIKPGIDITKKQLAALITKVQGASDDDFPTQVMQEVSAQVYAAKKWVDDQRAFFSSDDMKDKVEASWWRKFNYAASLVGQGQSMSWGAAKAINDGDLSGLKFHAAHLASDEVMNVIVINLVRPLTQIKSDMAGINVEQIKAPRLKQVFPQLVQDLDSAVTAAQSAANGVVAAGDQNLRVIHPGKIPGLFGAPLDKDNRGAPIFSGVTSLDILKNKCNYIVGIYRGYLDTIKKSVG